MTKEKKPSYKWVRRLVDKITKTVSPLNNSFEYYGYHIEQSSGTVDYTCVCIYDKGNWRNTLAEFDFDFWTKELHFTSYVDDDLRMAIVKAFVEFYNPLNVSDDTIEERRREYQEYIDNPDVYIEEAVENAKKEIEIIDSLPIGMVYRDKLK